MRQVILVTCYYGSSSYVYTVEVTGRRLETDEVKRLDLVNDDDLRRHEKSDYAHEWYEIKPRDRITITEGERGEEETMVFEIPTTPLTRLPQRLDDTFSMSLIECLEEHCAKVS